MGVLDALSVGRKAINAASEGINVTSQNVSNANTVGYSRRRVVTATSDPVLRKGLWIGSGVDTTGIRRASDRLLGARVVATAGTQAHAAALESTLSTAEGYLDEQGTTGLHEALASFYDALSGLSADPSDVTVRREAVNAASSLASTTTRVASGLQASIDGIDASLSERLSSINADLAQVASLNKAIGRSGANLGPGDLLDRRDQLVRELGEQAGATVDFSADGQATVFIGGNAAVSGGEARTLAAVTDAAGVAQITLSAGGGALRVTDDVGGELGGVLTGRSTIQGWLDQVDTFATTLATTVNAQHALGFDANGNPGGDLFTVDPSAPGATLSVSAALAADPSLLAVAGSATAAPGDADNLRSLLDLEGALDYGGRTGGDALSSLEAGVGSDTAAASADADTLTDQLGDLDAMRDSLSKVDVDEEAIQLIAFQTAYRAAARVLSASDEMLQTLLSMGA